MPPRILSAWRDKHDCPILVNTSAVFLIDVKKSVIFAGQPESFYDVFAVKASQRGRGFSVPEKPQRLIISNGQNLRDTGNAATVRMNLGNVFISH